MFFRRYWAYLKNFDWILLGSVFLLICFGLAALYGIAISYDQPDFVNFQKQFLFAGIGFIILFALSFLDYRLWQDYSYIIYFAVAISLILVLFFGITVRG